MQPVATSPTTAHPSPQPRPPALTLAISRRSVAIGAGTSLALAGTLTAVIAGLAGWTHLTAQLRSDWWLLAPLLIGVGVQVALVTELRCRRRLASVAAGAAGASAGLSGAGMVACCAHHAADLLPLAGAGGAAAFLTASQRPLMIFGIGANLAVILIAWRRLRDTRSTIPGGATCTH